MSWMVRMRMWMPRMIRTREWYRNRYRNWNRYRAIGTAILWDSACPFRVTCVAISDSYSAGAIDVYVISSSGRTELIGSVYECLCLARITIKFCSEYVRRILCVSHVHIICESACVVLEFWITHLHNSYGVLNYSHQACFCIII